MCEDCGQHDLLNVHHVNYRSLFDVEVDDLEILCRDCHGRRHGLLPDAA